MPTLLDWPQVFRLGSSPLLTCLVCPPGVGQSISDELTSTPPAVFRQQPDTGHFLPSAFVALNLPRAAVGLSLA